MNKYQTEIARQLARNNATHEPFTDGRSYWFSYSHTGLRTVYSPPVTDAVSYWVAMHELGHIVNKHYLTDYELYVKQVTGLVERRVISQEAEAWKWALDATPFKPTKAAAKMADRTFSTYLKDAAAGVPEDAQTLYATLKSYE